MKYFHQIKQLLNKDKKVYIFLLSVLLSGVLFGSVFMTLISKADKEVVVTSLNEFMVLAKESNINNIEVFKDVFISNTLFIVLLWALGISVIGLFFIVVMLFIKGFTLGFVISALIYKYKFLGIINCIIYLFPHAFINILVYLVVSYFAYKLSIQIFNSVIKKSTVNFREGINTYVKILLAAIIILLLTSLYESYVMPELIRLFKGLF